ncbi:hypothetical protein [Pseudonocardia acidicola]|uniref:HAMP domain-containing protein n=1 Tax=Pseudonocardia acidicola TaxID=2724939 RepID=A0ABX1SC93_9PSEU|nr:hypothetical protein [Pseudonocardia acidicola]NMH97864.1 hypothetical protein [Pseudonocardia acidicola]
MTRTTLQRARKRVTSSIEDAVEALEDVARTVGEEARRVGAETSDEFAQLPTQLDQARRAIAAAIEPRRSSGRFRRLLLLATLAGGAVTIGWVLGQRARSG